MFEKVIAAAELIKKYPGAFEALAEKARAEKWGSVPSAYAPFATITFLMQYVYENEGELLASVGYNELEWDGKKWLE